MESVAHCHDFIVAGLALGCGQVFVGRGFRFADDLVALGFAGGAAHNILCCALYFSPSDDGLLVLAHLAGDGGGIVDRILLSAADLLPGQHRLSAAFADGYCDNGSGHLPSSETTLVKSLAISGFAS